MDLKLSWNSARKQNKTTSRTRKKSSENDVEFLILLPLSSQYWDYRHVGVELMASHMLGKQSTYLFRFLVPVLYFETTCVFIVKVCFFQAAYSCWVLLLSLEMLKLLTVSVITDMIEFRVSHNSQSLIDELFFIINFYLKCHLTNR